jgi:hypothetical protein
MAMFQKKPKSPAPVLTREALLLHKREAWQESHNKLTSLQQRHADMVQQKAALEVEHRDVLVTAGFSEYRLSTDDSDNNLNNASADAAQHAVESQIDQLRRKIAALEAARVHEQAIHGELSREMHLLQLEISQDKHREYMTDLEGRVVKKKEQLIAHLYGGCGLLADLVRLADEAYAADDQAAQSGHAFISNAGRRFVQEALEDLNLRTTPIIMMERAGFAPVRSNLAFAHRAYEFRALIPPSKIVADQR